MCRCKSKQWETLVDEPLPRIPLEVRPITVTVTIGGKGRPRFRVETLTSIYDEDEGVLE